MTKYAGETLRIGVSAKDYRERLLTGADVLAYITIWDIDRVTVLVDHAQMTYSVDLIIDSDDDPGGWYYDWASPDVPGAYLAKTETTGTSSFDDPINSWEFTTVRVRANKAG